MRFDDELKVDPVGEIVEVPVEVPVEVEETAEEVKKDELIEEESGSSGWSSVSNTDRFISLP